MATTLGIDVGTQSVKALVYDGDRREVLASASAELQLIEADNGAREQKAHWWLDALAQCMAAIDPAIKQTVAGLAVSGQQHGFVPLDEAGEVIYKVKLWCDTTTSAECDDIAAAFGGQQNCIDSVGNAILPGYTAPKIRWLKNHKPEIYGCLHTILLPHDYINFYLTGNRCMEAGDASGTGLLDVRKREWHEGMLAAVDAGRKLASLLPPLIAANDLVGELLPEVAATLGLPTGIPVAAGGGDNMMAAIGTGNVVAGRMTASLGTSGTLFAYSDTPVIDSGGDIAAFCSSTGGWLPLLCTMNCTVATELTRDMFGSDVDAIERLAAQIPAGSDGLLTLPFYQGERTPNLPNGKGSLLGMDSANMSEGHLLRSAMEAAIFGLRTGLEAFERLGASVDEIRLTGGGAKNAVWRQIAADVLNKPVRVLQLDEGAALGAALQALAVIDAGKTGEINWQTFSDTHLTLDTKRACEPDPEAVAMYNAAYTKYQAYISALSPLFSA